ncbi:MAG: hypothetical protein HFE78_08495 [Clostridiales bacterium]|nr:hypothetical protein [Clostridiales bacterium]
MSCPAWWDQTITLYHRVADGGAVSWRRTVLDHCFWKETSAQSQKDLAAYQERSVTVRIPWREIPVSVGDILVLGAVDDEIDEYTSGERSTDLLAKYQGRAAKIQTVALNRQTGVGCPHIRIGGI